MNYMDIIEADTRIDFHAKHDDINESGEVVVQANDTDAAIILLASINLFSSGVWYESDIVYNNTREYLPITKLNKTMENPEAWIGLYSFLVYNDYTPAFYGKGKVRPIKLALSDSKFVKVFSSLGSIPLESKFWKRLKGMCVSCMGSRGHARSMM